MNQIRHCRRFLTTITKENTFGDENLGRIKEVVSGKRLFRKSKVQSSLSRKFLKFLKIVFKYIQTIEFLLNLV